MTEPNSSAIDLSVVVPCFNEELNLPELTTRVLDVFDTGKLSGELILVDDASRDGTARVIRELSQKYPGRVVGAFHTKNQGIAAGWMTGTKAAHGKNVAIIDADLQYQPEDLLRLYRTLMDHSVDVVQGWRSPTGRARGTRYNMSRGLNRMLNVAFGMDLRDNKSGFVCCAKEVMLDLLTHRGDYFYWQSFIMVAAHAKGYSYRQIETIFENRKQGTSFIDGQAYSAAAKSLVDIGKALIEYRLNSRPNDFADQFLAKNGVQAPEAPSPKAYPARWRAYMSTFEQTHWMITRDVERHYESLNKTQWLSPSQMRDFQDEKLRRLVRHAYRSVPYYRAKMQDAKLRPEDIRTQEDLPKLPYLTKADVRKHLHFDIRSENSDYDNILKIATSGSTGEPFVCYADRSQLEFRWAATLRSQEWTGYRFGDPTVRLWHQTIGMSKSQAFKEHADAFFADRTYIPIFEMTDAKLAEMIALISSKRPVLIDGYAEAFDFLAQYIAARGGLDFRPKALMSSAQTLPKKSREIIEKAFGCRVFDKYGSREFSGIAYECDAHAGHHVVGEGYIVEVLVDGRPAKPNETGEVVVTDLNNYCMPFIRYRIGDLAEGVVEAPCTCGRGMARIGDIQGRVQSIIQGTEGHYVPGTFFAHFLKEYDYAIKRFQVVQEEPGALTFRVVKGARYSDDVMDQVKATIRQFLGSELRIDVEFVENIEMVRTGKRLASVSKLPVDFQRNAPSRIKAGG
jgi:phenylacetate-CoA ligase